MTIEYSDLFNIAYFGFGTTEVSTIETLTNKVLQEIQDTPEGQTLFELIQLNGDENGQVVLNIKDSGDSLANRLSKYINISIGQLQNFGYYGADGELHNFTLQRALVHELFHLADDLEAFETNIEPKAVEFENEFMAKYYGDEDRRILYSIEQLVSEGKATNTILDNPNYDSDGHAGITYIGKSGETLNSLLTDMGVDEFSNVAGNYFYKIILDGNGVNSDAITTDYLMATGGPLGDVRVGYGHNDTLDTEDSKILFSFSGNDTITVSGSERIVYAGIDNDTVYASSSGINNYMDGGYDTDLLSYEHSTGPVYVDMVTGTMRHVSGPVLSDVIDTFTHFENITGSAFSDTLIGNSEDNVLIGGDGNDVLLGGDGNDILSGGSGNNSYAGGIGDDTYVISGIGTDTIAPMEPNDRISYQNATITGGAEMQYNHTWKVQHNGHELTITMNGNDLEINDGPDHIVTVTNGGQTGIGGVTLPGFTDTSAYQGAMASSGTTTADLYADSGSTSGSGGWGVALTGDAPDASDPYGPNVVRNDFLTGGAGDDTINGVNGDDLLVGGAGNDRLYGGGGNDKAFGGDGNDSITGSEFSYGGAGNDTIDSNVFADGGSGNDTINLGAGTYAPDAQAFGGDGDDYIWARGVGNSLYGGAGNDYILAYSGNLFVDAGEGANEVQARGLHYVNGNVHVIAGAGNDIIGVGFANGIANGNVLIEGGDGNNTLSVSGSMDATIVGGAGNDTITGGNDGANHITAGGGNNDISAYGEIHISAGAGNDTYHLAAFSSLDISDAGGTNMFYINPDNDFSLMVMNGSNTFIMSSATRDGVSITTGAGNDVFDFSSAYYYSGPVANVISAGEGNNTIIHASATNMQVTSGAGDDAIMVGSGSNTISAGNGTNTVTSSGHGDVITTGTGDDAITMMDGTLNAGSGANTITLNGYGTYAVDVTAGSGNDTVHVYDDGHSMNLGGGDNNVQLGIGYGHTVVEEDGITITTGSGNDTIALNYTFNFSATGSIAIDAGDGTNDVRISNSHFDATIRSGSGNDILKAFYGHDTLIGGGGADTLTGGSVFFAGKDTFLYEHITDSGVGTGNRDLITDFDSNFSTIDLSAFVSSFDWLGPSSFTGTSVAEGLYYDVSGHRVFALDTDGNGVANFEIEFSSLVGISYSDFV